MNVVRQLHPSAPESGALRPITTSVLPAAAKAPEHASGVKPQVASAS